MPDTDPRLLQVRVEINDAIPAIWRRLEVRSDISLATLHQALMAVFGWWDYHLHRFSIGGDPFDPSAELFLCPFDVTDGDEAGTPDADVRLGEVLDEPGDRLHYVYDYGDNWDLTIELEQVSALPAGAASARCLDGGRAAPPEDCGGLRTEAELAEIMDDPGAFDIDAVSAALADPFVGLAESGLRRDLVHLLDRLRATPAGDDLVVRAVGLAHEAATSPDERAAALHPILWFLDRVGPTGLGLTAAGYLRPDDVVAAADVVPAAADWIGTRNREVQTLPVLDFRQALQAAGLIRKAKGRLLLTKAGMRACGDPTALWRHLEQRLPLGKPGAFEGHAALLLLLYVASEPRVEAPHVAVANALTELGWRHGTGEPIGQLQVLWADRATGTLLQSVAAGPRPQRRHGQDRFSPVAADLARACLLGASRGDVG
ncbi:MAG: plasmid pRiA4b ORF-3 family protein [Candidatus Nanopelagicales bacterium]